jgi:hypothetical protein
MEWRKYMKTNDFLLILKFYNDGKPHKIYEQFYWIKQLSRKLSDKEFLKLHKKLFENGLIKAYGSEYLKTPFVKRQFIITKKGLAIYKKMVI